MWFANFLLLKKKTSKNVEKIYFNILRDEQPPYSPDLALCDFWLFHHLKRPLKGEWFDTIDAIKENVDTATDTEGRVLKVFFQLDHSLEEVYRGQGRIFRRRSM